MLKTYKVKPVHGQKQQKWAIYRPNGEIVNEAMFDSKKDADMVLSRLVAMKYCVKGG